jgi:hypothetical protein
MKNTVLKYTDFLKEDATTDSDSNSGALQANINTYNKYKSKITSMFSNATPEAGEKINKDFNTFIENLPEAEKGGSDMLRALFSSEKIKYDITGLENQKKVIEEQIQQRMDDLKKISANLK